MVEGESVSFGHRFYHPDEGRWVSRDPIGELAFRRRFTEGMKGLEWLLWEERYCQPAYLFVQNDPVSRFDFLGLFASACSQPGIAGSDRGGTVCRPDGTKVPCVWDSNWTHTPTANVRACAVKHEQTHVDNDGALGKPCDKGCGYYRGSSLPGKNQEDECKAYKATSDCLDALTLSSADVDSYLEMKVLVDSKKPGCVSAGHW